MTKETVPPEDKNQGNNLTDYFKRKSLKDILNDNEVDFDHQGIKALLDAKPPKPNFVPEKSHERLQIEELRYQRFMATQELLIERFNKIERSVDKIEKISKENLETTQRSAFTEEQFWESKDFNKDEKVKKATHLGFFVLLAVAVGMLLPYWKSEKLVLVNNDQALSALEKNSGENLNEMEKLVKGKAKSKQNLKASPRSYGQKDFLVSDKFVNIRIRPSPKAKKLFTLSPNVVIEKIDQKGGWVKIIFKDYIKGKTKTGWAWLELLRKVRP